MKLLINKQDMAEFVQVTKKANDTVFNQFIQEAQYIDLQNLLCERYFNDLLLNPDDYKELINGGTYEAGGVTYIHAGLKAVLTYFAYARYRMFGNEVSTAYGMVTKVTDVSQPVDMTNKKIANNYYRKVAMTYWQRVLDFLVRTNYKGYNDICKNAYCVDDYNKDGKGMRINVIKPKKELL